MPKRKALPIAIGGAIETLFGSALRWGYFLQKRAKKIKKGVDKGTKLWYNSQALDERAIFMAG